jgi:Rrf2 family transcriptional regulator, cysteine metabolism repressor
MSLKLSTKCRYGARAILEIAKNYGKRPTKRKDIAHTQEISESYLENILLALKSNGLIDTVRGAQGGYELGRSPSGITLFQIVEALEGSLDLVDCLADSSACGRVGECAMRGVWSNLKKAMEETLSCVTLQDLLDKNRSEALSFCI